MEKCLHVNPPFQFVSIIEHIKASDSAGYNQAKCPETG